MNNNRMEFNPVYTTGQRGPILYTDPVLYQLACEKKNQMLAVRVFYYFVFYMKKRILRKRVRTQKRPVVPQAKWIVVDSIKYKDNDFTKVKVLYHRILSK